VAYFALIKLHKLPHEVFSLPEHELAIVYALMDEYTQHEKREAAKIKRR